MNGVDVSHHNGVIDWAAVAAANITMEKVKVVQYGPAGASPTG